VVSGDWVREIEREANTTNRDGPDNVVRKELTRRATNSLMDHFCILANKSFRQRGFAAALTGCSSRAHGRGGGNCIAFRNLRLKKLSSSWLTDASPSPSQHSSKPEEKVTTTTAAEEEKEK
jgi:hypothetical protein